MKHLTAGIVCRSGKGSLNEEDRMLYLILYFMLAATGCWALVGYMWLCVWQYQEQRSYGATVLATVMPTMGFIGAAVFAQLLAETTLWTVLIGNAFIFIVTIMLSVIFAIAKYWADDYCGDWFSFCVVVIYSFIWLLAFTLIVFLA